MGASPVSVCSGDLTLQHCACGKTFAHASRRQSCSGVGETKYFTGPICAIIRICAGSASTGELIHTDPSTSFTTIIREGNENPNAGIGGPPAVQMFSPNACSCTLRQEFGEARDVDVAAADDDTGAFAACIDLSGH